MELGRDAPSLGYCSAISSQTLLEHSRQLELFGSQFVTSAKRSQIEFSSFFLTRVEGRNIMICRTALLKPFVPLLFLLLQSLCIASRVQLFPRNLLLKTKEPTRTKAQKSSKLPLLSRVIALPRNGKALKKTTRRAFLEQNLRLWTDSVLVCPKWLDNPVQKTVLFAVAAVAISTLMERNPIRTKIATTLDAYHRAIYFWIRAGPMVAHYRFTQWWLKVTNAPIEKRDEVYNALHNTYCDPSYDIILYLKGLYVKIGQVLSSRPDVVPRQYIDLFSTLFDSIPPWPLDHVKELISTSFLSNYGLTFEEVFQHMEEIPLGCASIGQVHVAMLRTNSTNQQPQHVAVKVMHPDAKIRFRHDFGVFKWLCRVALPGWKTILLELEKQIMEEFDYLNEASALEQVKQNVLKSPYRNQVHVPQAIHSLCTKHVLVMELLEGTKLVDSTLNKLKDIAFGGNETLARDFLEERKRELFLGKDNNENGVSRRAFFLRDTTTSHTEKNDTSVSAGSGRRFWTTVQHLPTAIRLLALERQMRLYLNRLLDVHGYQIFINGCFNGDPHPGNILEMPDGRLGLIDYGQCRRLERTDRLAMANIVVLLGTKHDNSTRHKHEVAQAMRDFGFQTRYDRDDTLAHYAALFFDSDIEGKRMGFATPQLYLMHLTKIDPLVHVPDPAVFVARASFLFRGMGGLLEEQIQTAKWWCKHAKVALSKERESREKSFV